MDGSGISWTVWKSFASRIRIDNHASTSSLNFFTGQMLFLTPTQQHQSTEGKNNKHNNKNKNVNNNNDDTETHITFTEYCNVCTAIQIIASLTTLVPQLTVRDQIRKQSLPAVVVLSTSRAAEISVQRINLFLVHLRNNRTLQFHSRPWHTRRPLTLHSLIQVIDWLR